MDKSTERNENGYLARNSWLVYVIAALLFVSGQWMLNTIDLGFKLPSILTYIIASISLVIGGFLNMTTDTLSAKIFRTIFIALVLFFAIGCLLKMLGLY